MVLDKFMKICGIICEFNPLHNGHEHLIRVAKSKYDYVICLMSGNFTQRGKPTCLCKYDRAALAITAGADMVLEFPTIFAVNGADEFAKHAIKILNNIGCNSILFGSESNDRQGLEKMAAFKLTESKSFKHAIKKHMNDGNNYNQAYLIAMSDITHDKTLLKLASNPNDILASCYIKEIKKQKLKMNYDIIKRLDNGYNDKTHNEKYLSASSILELKNNSEDYSIFVPKNTFDALNHSSKFDYEKYFSLLQYKITNSTAKELSQIFGIDEGFENKIKHNINLAKTYNELLISLESKRYRKTRIEKMLYYILIDLTKTNYNKLSKINAPLKVLAINDLSKNDLLHLISKTKTKLITKNKDYNSLSKKHLLLSQYDQKATNIYSICTSQPLNKDLQTGLQIIKTNK